MPRPKIEKRYVEILPLVCHSCAHRWERIVTSEMVEAPCPRCRSLKTGVLPPSKILDSNRANHYNDLRIWRKGAAEETTDSPEPERVLRAQVLEPVEIEEVIVEEIG